MTSAGFSCWTQWPAPSTSTVPRWSVSHCSAAAGGRHHQHGVEGAADEEGGHGDALAGELGRDLPVAVEVAVPADRPGEAGALELGGVVVELGLRQPVGQALGLGHAVDEAAAVVGEERGRVGAAAVGRHRGAAEHPAHGAGRVASELGVGHPRLLEVEHVEEGVPEELAHHLRRRLGPAGHERHAHPDHSRHPLGGELGQGPGDDRPPVVADHDGLLDALGVEDGEQVAGEVLDVVVLDGLWSTAPAVAPLVGGEHPVAGRGEGGDLVAPRVGELGEPVGEQDGEPLPRGDDVQVDVAARDGALDRRGVGGGHRASRGSEGSVQGCRSGRSGVRRPATRGARRGTGRCGAAGGRRRGRP